MLSSNVLSSTACIVLCAIDDFKTRFCLFLLTEKLPEVDLITKWPSKPHFSELTLKLARSETK